MDDDSDKCGRSIILERVIPDSGDPDSVWSRLSKLMEKFECDSWKSWSARENSPKKIDPEWQAAQVAKLLPT